MIIPQFKDPEVTKFLNLFQKDQDQKFKNLLSSIKGNQSLLLFAPNLSVWEIKVSNAGAITATKIAG